MNNRYSEVDVQRILTAYREVFPEINEGLRKYWDLDRARPWAYLTTDFHRASYDALAELSERTEQINRDIEDVTLKANALVAASRTLGVGFSIGISPWTDHGLFSTYASHKTKATVVLAHDWYPIVVKKSHERDQPLFAQGLATLGPPARANYHSAVPPELLTGGGDRVLLFLNLYPHYRPPGADVMGQLTEEEYRGCREGFLGVLEATLRRFDDVDVISWGRYTWNQLRKLLPPDPVRVKLSDNWGSGAVRRLHSIPVGRHKVRYLPLAHPSHSGNFRTKGETGHLKYLEFGLSQLAGRAAFAAT